MVLDSNAILLYLAEKTGQFLPENIPAARADMRSWLMFVATGIGPYSGQAVHFNHFAPEPKDYALNRTISRRGGTGRSSTRTSPIAAGCSVTATRWFCAGPDPGGTAGVIEPRRPW